MLPTANSAADKGVVSKAKAHLMKVGLFLYDNGTFILESFRDFSCKVRVHLAGGGKKLADIRTGKEIPALYRRDKIIP